jgi:hypothetical protein
LRRPRRRFSSWSIVFGDKAWRSLWHSSGVRRYSWLVFDDAMYVVVGESKKVPFSGLTKFRHPRSHLSPYHSVSPQRSRSVRLRSRQIVIMQTIPSIMQSASTTAAIMRQDRDTQEQSSTQIFRIPPPKSRVPLKSSGPTSCHTQSCLFVFQ